MYVSFFVHLVQSAYNSKLYQDAAGLCENTALSFKMLQVKMRDSGR